MTNEHAEINARYAEQIAKDRASYGDIPGVRIDNPVPDIDATADAAANAVEVSHHSAELLRAQGTTIMSIAQTIKTEGDALALDIEKRIERFAAMVATFNDYAAAAHATFDAERERLNQFQMPGAKDV